MSIDGNIQIVGNANADSDDVVVKHVVQSLNAWRIFVFKLATVKGTFSCQMFYDSIMDFFLEFLNTLIVTEKCNVN